VPWLSVGGHDARFDLGEGGESQLRPNPEGGGTPSAYGSMSFWGASGEQRLPPLARRGGRNWSFTEIDASEDVPDVGAFGSLAQVPDRPQLGVANDLPCGGLVEPLKQCHDRYCTKYALIPYRP
jgi:hypothetical protein